MEPRVPWGAALRGDVPGVTKDDEAGATTLMNGVIDERDRLRQARRASSIQNFEAGNGDVAITYENEVKTANSGRARGRGGLPQRPVLIENPVAVVDKNADEHCVA